MPSKLIAKPKPKPKPLAKINKVMFKPLYLNL